MKKITITLDEKSITDAIKELQAYRKWIDEKTRELTERLAVIGAMDARIRFSNALYDGDNDVEISVEPTATGYSIVARGQSVCFIEFGAGSTYGNGYPDKPNEIAPIGTYGKGKGSQSSWAYYGEPGTGGKFLKSTDKGDLYMTKGNSPNMAMYYATRKMQDEVLRIAKEVFA